MSKVEFFQPQVYSVCVVGVQPTNLIFQPHWYLSVTQPSHRSLKCMVIILGARPRASFEFEF